MFLLSIAGYFISNFFQLRGYVNILASRIVLGFAIVALLILACIFAASLQKNKVVVGIFACLIVLAFAVGLDRFTLPHVQPQTVPTSKPQSSGGSEGGQASQQQRSPGLAGLPTGTPRPHRKIMDTEKMSQLRLYKLYEFSPPRPGGTIGVNVFWENVGPSTVELSTRARVSVSVSRTSDPIPAWDWPNVEEGAWKSFMDNEPKVPTTVYDTTNAA
jgi:hypothetical protein